MRCASGRIAMAWTVAVIVCGAGTEARGQYARRTPIVEAVQKTRAAIVTIKVEILSIT